MYNRNALVGTAASLLMSFASLSVAQAQESAPPPTAVTSPAVPSASVPNPRQQCAQDNGIVLPAEKGAGPQLTKEQRQTIWKCVMAAKEKAHAQCASAAGFTPGQGQKPSPDQRKAIRQCMNKLGFNPHHGHGRWHREKEGQAS
jgi:hypothetical protein